MKRLNLKKDNLILNKASVFLIILAEMCLYKEDKMLSYQILVITGVILSALAILINLGKNTGKGKKFLVWITLVYLMCFVYGFTFLKNASFPWDSLLLRLVESIVLFISIKEIVVREDFFSIAKIFSIISILMVLYLLASEGVSALFSGIRIGGELSDTVNTVGFNLGLLSTIALWAYTQNKRTRNLILFVVLAVLSLFTGSKKALLLLIINGFMFLLLEKNNLKKWAKVLIVGIISMYAIFSIPTVYSVLGRRVENMFSTMFSEGYSIGEYSYSTDMRKKMISEGLSFASERPVFGGGWGYFASRTTTGYNYSHNNYVELLCSFGVIGFALYYSLLANNLTYSIKKLLKRGEKDNYPSLVLSLTLLIIMIIIDWTAVTFSAQCIWHLPIIVSSVIISGIGLKEATEKDLVILADSKNMPKRMELEKKNK